jgi:anti-anti-sigma factor
MRADRRGSTLQAGRTESGYLVRVQGRGTMQESPAVHEFAVQSLDGEPATSTFVIDLTACEYLDSTFLGCLATLHRRYNRSMPHRFWVAAPLEKSQRLLGSSGLNRLLDITERSPALVDELLETLGQDLPPHELGRHVMECHRRLAELGGPNQSAYRSIAQQLARELGEEPATDDYQIGPR